MIVGILVRPNMQKMRPSFAVLCGALLLCLVWATSAFPEPVWTPCYLYSERNYTGSGILPESECTNFTLPLNHSEPQRATIDIFVKRTLTAGAQRALFIVAGGPGDSGARVDGHVPVFHQNGSIVTTAYDLYQVDHRGTGRSHRLGCYVDSADSAGDCVADLIANYSSVLPHMTVTNAALDYKEIINYVKTSRSQSAVIYAAGYGSYLTNRLLTVVPDIVSAVVLDGIMAGTNKFADADANLNVTAKIFAEGCDLDATCSKHIGPNAFEEMSHIVANFDKSPCATPATSAEFKRAQFRMALNSILRERDARAGMFPLLYRFRRCSFDDMLKILNAVQKLKQPGSPPVDISNPLPAPILPRVGFSRALFNHIALSEMWNVTGVPSPSASELDAISDTVVVGSFEPGKRALLFQKWGPILYSPDQYADLYASTSVPVLLLNGQLDTVTAVNQARQARSEAFSGANQRLIEIPEATHPSLLNSPVVGSSVHCGARIVASFLNQQAFDVNSVDTTCLNNLARTDYSGSSAATLDYAQRIFGTTDIWGATTAAPVATPEGAAVSLHHSIVLLLASVLLGLLLFL